MPLLALAFFIFIYLVLAWRRPDWALLILIASLPAYLIRFSVAGLPATLLEAMILISFGAWFFKSFLPNWRRNRAKRQPYPYAWELIALLILSLAAAGIAGFSLSALGIWKAYFFEPALLFILLFNVFQEKKDWQRILYALLLSTLAVSSFAIVQKISGIGIANPFWEAAETRRVVSFFGYPNALGLYLAPIIMVLSGWLFSLSWQNIFDRWRQKALIACGIFSALLAIYFARSDGALVAVAAAGFVFLLLAARWTRWVALAAALTLAGFFYLFPPSLDLSDKFSLRDLSGEIRRQQWRETSDLLRDGRLLSGAGLNNYQAAVAPYHQDGIFFNADRIPDFHVVTWASSTLREKYWQPVEIYLYPHNIFLNFWTELGLLGLLLFVWLMAKHLVFCWQATRTPDPGSRYLALGLAGAMIAILVQGLVDVPYFKNDLAALFWIILAFAAYLRLEARGAVQRKI